MVSEDRVTCGGQAVEVILQAVKGGYDPSFQSKLRRVSLDFAVRIEPGESRPHANRWTGPLGISNGQPQYSHNFMVDSGDQEGS